MQTFEFNKPGENPTTAPVPVEEQHKIDGTEPAIQPDPAPVQTSEPDAIDEAKETALSAPPVSPMQESESGEQSGDVMHHLTYLAHGIWNDAEGQYWHREDGKKGCISHKVISTSKLNSRPDLLFMIRYGAIKDVIVQ